MVRRTKYIVYVDKAILDRPFDVASAVMAHLIKKGVDTLERKKFFMAVRSAPTEQRAAKVIDEWVQVRDIAEFPFRKGKQEGNNADEDQGTEGGVSVDDSAEPESEQRTASDRCDT